MARPSAAEDVFRAIADPTRRTIHDLLRERDRTAGELANSFDLCQSTVSEHLAALRKAGLVTFEEQGGRRTYTLRPERLRVVLEWVAPHG